MYQAHLIGVYSQQEMPEDLQGFVEFQAKMEDRQLGRNERVAMLVITGTSSYVPVFIEALGDLKDLDRRLALQDAEMDEVTRESLTRVIDELRSRAGTQTH